MGLKTILLKLHQPGKTKREILDQAILNYNKAYQFLLGKAYLSLDEIQEKYKDNKGFYNANTLAKWVDSNLSRELNQFHVQPFKDSLKLELGMTLASYLRLRVIDPRASFPKINVLFDHAGNLKASREECFLEYEKLRPIYFCRYDITRSYCILYDRKKDRYFVKLHLMNVKNAHAVVPRPGKESGLEYIHKSGKVFTMTKQKATFLVLPLSFGKYQEAYLRKALEQPEVLRTAKLMKKGREYFLAVSIETENAQPITHETFLGITRGLKNKLNYTLIDEEDNILDSGGILEHSFGSRQGNIHLSELHKAANSIVAIALENKSQVILQNLEKKGDRINGGLINGSNVQPWFKCRKYIELSDILAYKLPETGLPSPVKVSSVDIFYSCHVCGSCTKRNQFNQDIFICIDCGATMDMEKLGSLNLARKLMKYSTTKIKVRVEKTAEGSWFINEFMDLKYFVPSGENQVLRLRTELERITEDIKNNVKDLIDQRNNKKISLMKKLDNAEDVIDMIEFVS